MTHPAANDAGEWNLETIGGTRRWMDGWIIIIIISLVSRWYYAHGCGLVPASGELGFSIAKRLGLLSSIDNWDVGDDQAHR